jgi:hypothetical protein
MPMGAQLQGGLTKYQRVITGNGAHAAVLQNEMNAVHFANNVPSQKFSYFWEFRGSGCFQAQK